MVVRREGEEDIMLNQAKSEVWRFYNGIIWDLNGDGFIDSNEQQVMIRLEHTQPH